MSSSEPIEGLCGAQLRKKPGRYCEKLPVPGRRRCRLHGGAQVRGPARHNYKHGRYAQFLGSSTLGEAYRESVKDAQLGDLRESVAMLDAIVKRTAARTTDLDTPDFRARAVELHGEVRASLASKDFAVAAVKLEELGALLRRGVEEDEAFEKLTSAIDVYARRAEGAWKVELAKGNAIAAADLVTVMHRIADSVARHADKVTARKILDEIERMMEPPKGLSSSSDAPREIEVEG